MLTGQTISNAVAETVVRLRIEGFGSDDSLCWARNSDGCRRRRWRAEIRRPSDSDESGKKYVLQKLWILFRIKAIEPRHHFVSYYKSDGKF